MKKLTLNDFIGKAKLVHDNKYNYSKVKYINSKTKVCIICHKHGEFWQTPLNHICGKTNCPKCSKIHHHSEIENNIGNFLLKTYPNLTITSQKSLNDLKIKHICQ